MLNPASLKQCFIRQVEHTIKQVRADVRDPWPASLDAYEMRGVLSKGKFGEIKIMATYDNDLMSTDGNASRTCAIKTVFLNKFFDRVVQESREKKKPTLLQVKSPKESLERILRRIGMELFVNMRCRHENILHFHAVFLNSDGLNLAMPRFHVLREMIDTYRDLHNYEPIPMAIIARIVRQLCEGLNYLHSAGIIHRFVFVESFET